MIKVLEVNSIYEVDKKTKMNLKLMAGFKRLDMLEEGAELDIFNMAEIKCHMDGDPENRDPKRQVDSEYSVYALFTEDSIYSTSSESFKRDIEDMLSELDEGQGVRVRIIKIKSKNNEGKFFRAELLDFIE